MIAMQYSFTLPADYDMAIIDRRITEKGPLLDGFPNLRFKAYLTARRGGTGSDRENLYAPFYLWDNSTGLNDFLCGDGFAGVSGAFGWPRVRTWMVWQARVSDRVAEAAFATREISAIEPHAPLGELRRREDEATIAAVETGGALAAVAGFDPTGWTRVRFRLWPQLPSAAAGQVYTVGHMSLPTA
jgi:hypothetical protein